MIRSSCSDEPLLPLRDVCHRRAEIVPDAASAVRSRDAALAHIFEDCARKTGDHETIDQNGIIKLGGHWQAPFGMQLLGPAPFRVGPEGSAAKVNHRSDGVKDSCHAISPWFRRLRANRAEQY